VPSKQVVDSTTQEEAAIRDFMAKPDLELTFVKTDVPFPTYFRVGKVSQVNGGENMEAVEGWTRKVNIYRQKELLNGQCSVYEYHIDPRNHSLVAVVIAGLTLSEIEEYKNNGITCITTSTNNMPKITKAEAETIAKDYIRRAVPNLDQIWGQFTYSSQSNDESHQWLWEDKDYKLPEGLEGRPWSHPIIRISISGNKEIQYWNTVSLFQN